MDSTLKVAHTVAGSTPTGTVVALAGEAIAEVAIPNWEWRLADVSGR